MYAMKMPRNEDHFDDIVGEREEWADIDTIPTFDEFRETLGSRNKIDADIIFFEVFPEQLTQCKAGTEIILWSREDYEFINGYREGTGGGEGKVFSMLKADNPQIAECFDLRHPIWAIVTDCENGKFNIEFKVDRNIIEK
jgi:hypothetical protein